MDGVHRDVAVNQTSLEPVHHEQPCYSYHRYEKAFHVVSADACHHL